MNVLIIANFVRMPNEKGNDRFNYLADLLSKKNEVELITSSFNHMKKEQRKIEEEAISKLKYKLTFIFEPGYKKNISLKRFNSHYKMSINLKKYLKNLNYKPDVIYCAIPSLDVGKVAAEYAKKNNIKFVIDVQDLWPEAFSLVFNIPIISNMIFYPMKRIADNIYKSADDIIAVSDTYKKRATKVNNKYKNALSVFLGTELDYFDKCKKENEKTNDDNWFKLVYIGTLGHSYDLKIIMDAMKILKNEGINNIKFVIIGDGPLRDEFKKYGNGLECEFKGLMEYSKMVGELCSCDIAVNPISKGAAQSITNKIGDYAAAGLPVINTQECSEYRKLIKKYEIGFNCENTEEIAERIKVLYEDKLLKEKLGRNNRKLAEEKFDRKVTYKNIVKIIEE